jgi:transposase-like protein
MNNGNHYPTTLIQAVRHFSDLDVAHDFFAQARWPDGIICCPTCGSTEVKYLGAKYRRWECKEKHPRRQFTVKVGTIMEDSPLGLDKWAVAFWLEANAKNSISSYEIHRALGITQKSAWFMQHRIRLAMQDKTAAKLSGIVEADETAIGGKASNMHRHIRERRIGKGTGFAGKAVVMGLLARGGEVRTEVMHDMHAQAIRTQVEKHVEPGTMLMTDELHAYKLMADKYAHQFVNHAIEYVRGSVHTNGLENFWALFKRCVKGTHVSIEPCHLFRYLDAECFRFNKRKLTDGERMIHATAGYAGKRLTYKELIGAMEDHPDTNDSIAGKGNPLN